MQRRVEPELLDDLAPQELAALASRRDLVRLNRWMRHDRILVRHLRAVCSTRPPRRIADLGAGDGALTLMVARRLAHDWQDVEVCLVDRGSRISEPTIQEIQALGWRVRFIQADVIEWLAHPGLNAFDVMIANLFLHHFDEAVLRRLLHSAARLASVFLACEPRRARHCLLASRALFLAGCNAVTRHDAPVSVRAGFHGKEISALWPASNAWRMTEQRAGCFTHLFLAERRRSPS